MTSFRSTHGVYKMNHFLFPHCFGSFSFRKSIITKCYSFVTPCSRKYSRSFFLCQAIFCFKAKKRRMFPLIHTFLLIFRDISSTLIQLFITKLFTGFLQELAELFSGLLVTRFPEQCKHVFLVALHARLVKRIHAEQIAADTHCKLKEVEQFA